MSPETVWNELDEQGIDYIQLQFTDLFGSCKQLLIHKNEWEKALEGRILFDGSSVEGFGGVASSDLLLKPDPDTLHIRHWRTVEEGGPLAAAYCDVYRLDGEPAEGCTRSMLKRVLQQANRSGYRLLVGIEGEFFLMRHNGGEISDPVLLDRAGYCDPSPFDRSEAVRIRILNALQKQGFRIEAAHHEVAPGQHEINFRFGEALEIADRWQMFKEIVAELANRDGLVASFMPKPYTGKNGNAMHCNQSLENFEGTNAFYDRSSPDGLSSVAHRYMSGLLAHAKGMAPIANPAINSYKRLLPGYEAPTHIAWSRSNRTASIRVPGARGRQTRVEYRTPDAMANPYLLFAVMLKAGLEGLANKGPSRTEAVGNIYEMNERERALLGIENYPRDLHAALDFMAKDDLIEATMGAHSFDHYLRKKREEADLFAAEVHPWERNRYL